MLVDEIKNKMMRDLYLQKKYPVKIASATPFEKHRGYYLIR